MVGRIMAPKEVRILTPRSYGCVALYGKRDFADVIKLRVSRWGGEP